jgi:hypothetical protein
MNEFPLHTATELFPICVLKLKQFWRKRGRDVGKALSDKAHGWLSVGFSDIHRQGESN